MPRTALRSFACLALAAAGSLAAPGDARAHGQSSPIDADHVRIQTDAPPAGVAFEFHSTDAGDFYPAHDPAQESAALFVRSVGANEGRTPLISFDPALWTTAGPSHFTYADPSGARGGVTSVEIAPGLLSIEADAAGWSFAPSGPQDEVWVHFRVEDEWFCARFAPNNSTIQTNVAGHFEAVDAIAPGSCPVQACGNGLQELGEECDDGNLAEGDGCDPDCTIGLCNSETFETTFEGIQKVIFESEAYGCSRGTCHDPVFPDGNLDLSHDAAYVSLLGEDGLGAPADDLPFRRVLPTEPAESLLYLKLLAKNQGAAYQGPDVGTGMPTGLTGLSDDHLEAVRLWIRGGAPLDRVVEGTAQLLGTCFPPPDALKTPVPDAPAADTGFQLRQTPYPLLGVNPPVSQGETELCMATYYDLSARAPADVRIPCPEEFRYRLGCSKDPATACTDDEQCGEDGPCIAVKNAMNPGNECIAYDRVTVIQDPQSHHSILGNYTGRSDLTDPCWGDPAGSGFSGSGTCDTYADAWTYKFEPGENDALNGQPCDPTAIDPALGYNPGCSSKPIDSIACLGYGPSDLGSLSVLSGGGGSNFPQLSLSQETYFDFRYAPGVHNVMPIKGVMVWNSHAFNLTPNDSTMAQFLNIEFAPEEERVYPAIPIFDAGWIFAQFVPPFEQREVCATWTAPQGARIFQLSSHTHRHGTRWRTWAPPNTPCRPQCPTAQDDPFLTLLDQFGVCDADSPLPLCEGPRTDQPLYFSTDYSDPLNLDFDPPLAMDDGDEADRTFLYCSVFDNGATESSPVVKQHQYSPMPPDTFGLGNFLEVLGGPCPGLNLACMAGPNKGQKCADPNTWVPDHAFCDTSPGAGDGECDACPVHGGVTTEDEMFILLGSYYMAPEPGDVALGAAAAAALAALARRRRA